MACPVEADFENAIFAPLGGPGQPGLSMNTPNTSAPPFPVANPTQAGRPRRKYSLYSAPCLGGPHIIRYRKRVRSGPAFRKVLGGAAFRDS